MNCDAASELLNAWIDGELPPAEAAVLQAHLADCPECQSLAQRMRAQHAELKQAFYPQRAAASQLAANVLAAIGRDAPAISQPVPATGFGWGALLLALAAGFLLAVALFQPWRQRPEGAEPRETVEMPQPEPPIAHLVVATGAVEMRAPPATDWRSYTDIKAFRCPSRGEIRTGADVRCELQTAEGCVIRLNHDTEIALDSPTSVAIRRGQIWCSSPDNVSLKVVAPETAAPAKPAASPWSLKCPSSSCVLTADQPGGDMQVLTSAGETELQTAHGRERLRPGERASIVDGQIIRSTEASDPLLEAPWVNSLLTCKPKGDGELAQRINEMLAQVGRSKVTWLYEQEIRGLGEHAVLPLLRYVQSPQSSAESEPRLQAMRLLSDLSPSWTVPELIELLSDDNAEIRVLAATALQRLTGLTHGRPPQQWRSDPEQCAATVEEWRQWWTNNRRQYPARPPAESAT